MCTNNVHIHCVQSHCTHLKPSSLELPRLVMFSKHVRDNFDKAKITSSVKLKKVCLDNLMNSRDTKLQ